MPEVRDISAAAALVAWGHRILATVGNDFKVFHFAPEAEADLQAFYTNAPIPVRDYARAIKKIRGIVHEGR